MEIVDNLIRVSIQKPFDRPIQFLEVTYAASQLPANRVIGVSEDDLPPVLSHQLC